MTLLAPFSIRLSQRYTTLQFGSYNTYNIFNRPPPPSPRMQDNAVFAELLLMSADPAAVMPGADDPTLLQEGQ